MKKKSLKLILILLLPILISIAYYFDLQEMLTLENLQMHRLSLLTLYESNRWAFIFVFVGGYTLYTSLSIPSAVLLTITAGAVFGSFFGTFLSVLGATLGGTVSFLLARFLFRESIEARMHERIVYFNKEVEKHGFFFLLSLRMIPVFPYFLLNLGFGLTRISFLNYVLATFLGLFPTTFLYAHAGNQLSKITSIREIASPQIGLVFLILGLIAISPVIYKKKKSAALQKAIREGELMENIE